MTGSLLTQTPDATGAAEDAELARVLESYLADLDAGRAVDRAALLAAHPLLAERLEACLASLQFVEQAGSEIRVGAIAESLGEERATLGDFRLIREIGRGGMGVVYEAEQMSLGRRVAVKVLPFAGMLDKQQLNRFKNEARAAATLDHPNIVAIHSVGTERGVHYYAMQLIEGLSLAQVIEQLREKSVASRQSSVGKNAPAPSPRWRGLGRGEEADTRNDLAQTSVFPTTDDGQLTTDTQPVAALSTLPDFNSREYYRSVARLGIQAAEALDHAHQNGVLHRDVKPGNLMIDDAGKLWITDFGLARIEADAGMTMTGDILGTLRYMSPEQALANRVIIDHRSDIYSLGVTLYELLTLRPVFIGNDRHELMRQIAFADPRRPRQVTPAIPKDLETIVLKAIDKNPRNRYANAQELADDLHRFVEHRPIQARPPKLKQHLTKFARRHRAAISLILFGSMLVSIAATAALADRRRQLRETRFTVETSLSEARKALEADDVNQADIRLAEAQARIDVARLRGPGLVEDVAALRFEVSRYREFKSIAGKEQRHMTGAEATKALALYHVLDKPDWLNELNSLDLAKEHVNRITESVYDLLLFKADDLTRWPGEWPEATRQTRVDAQSREAIEVLQRAVSFHSPSRGYYWLLANCRLQLGDRDEERRLRKVALAISPNSAAELFYINRDRVWGTVSKHRGYPEYAFEDNYKDHREMLRAEPQYYIAMYFMALRLAGEERYAEALVGWYGCLALNPEDTSAVMHRALAHAQLGHVEEANNDIDAVLAAEPETAGALKDVALLLATNANDGVRDGARAICIAEQGCKVTEYEDPALLDALGCAYAELGNFEAATKWSEMAVGLCQTDQREKYAEHLELFRRGKSLRKH